MEVECALYIDRMENLNIFYWKKDQVDILTNGEDIQDYVIFDLTRSQKVKNDVIMAAPINRHRTIEKSQKVE